MEWGIGVRKAPVACDNINETMTVAFITDSNNDSDFNSYMKMYACINEHQKNYLEQLKKIASERKYQAAL